MVVTCCNPYKWWLNTPPKKHQSSRRAQRKLQVAAAEFLEVGIQVDIADRKT